MFYKEDDCIANYKHETKLCLLLELNFNDTIAVLPSILLIECNLQ